MDTPLLKRWFKELLPSKHPDLPTSHRSLLKPAGFFFCKGTGLETCIFQDFSQSQMDICILRILSCMWYRMFTCTHPLCPSIISLFFLKEIVWIKITFKKTLILRRNLEFLLPSRVLYEAMHPHPLPQKKVAPVNTLQYTLSRSSFTAKRASILISRQLSWQITGEGRNREKKKETASSKFKFSKTVYYILNVKASRSVWWQLQSPVSK